MRFQLANPFRESSVARGKFESYRKAATLGEAVALRVGKAALEAHVAAGHLTFPGATSPEALPASAVDE